MSKLTLYHGSYEIVGAPVWGIGKEYNDYGRGFYCTESLELAREWACTEGVDGYVNGYELELEGLRVLDLSSKEYGILHWLALLVQYRRFRFSSPVMARGGQWLLDNYLLDIKKYDVIIGYRADDSYFSFAKAFLNNTISLAQLEYAMRLGKLGEQVVLKSEEVFARICPIWFAPVDGTIYYARRKRRDEEARVAFFRELEKEDVDGVYIRDLIKKGEDR